MTTESILRFIEAVTRFMCFLCSMSAVVPNLLVVCRPAVKEVEFGREVVAELIAHPVVFLLVHDEVIDKDWQVRNACTRHYAFNDFPPM